MMLANVFGIPIAITVSEINPKINAVHICLGLLQLQESSYSLPAFQLNSSKRTVRHSRCWAGSRLNPDQGDSRAEGGKENA